MPLDSLSCELVQVWILQAPDPDPGGGGGGNTGDAPVSDNDVPGVIGEE